MKRLQTRFLYKGFVYEQKWRNENYAIYSQWLNGELIAYEAIKIKKNDSYQRFGKYYEAAESYPTDNQWGINGFTSMFFDEAQKNLLKHFHKIQKLVLESRYKPQTPLNVCQNTTEAGVLHDIVSRVEENIAEAPPEVLEKAEHKKKFILKTNK